MVFQSAAQEIAVIGVYIDIATDNAVPSVVQAPGGAANVTRRSAGRAERRKSQPGRRQNVAATGPTVLLETVFSQVGAIATPGTKVATGPLAMSEIVGVLKAGSFQGYVPPFPFPPPLISKEYPGGHVALTDKNRYMGSLTTPPCSEGVNWLVSTAHLAATRATFNAARDFIGFNSRFPQNTPGQTNLLALGSVTPAAAAPVPVAEVPGGIVA